MNDADAHMSGFLRFVASDEKARVKRWMETPDGHAKLLRALQHKLSMDPRYAVEPPKGERSRENLLQHLRRLGAPKDCYIISSYGQHDGSFHELERVVLDLLGDFTHGTLISSIPGRLALFRTAFPFQHLICHRPD